MLCVVASVQKRRETLMLQLGFRIIGSIRFSVAGSERWSIHLEISGHRLRVIDRNQVYRIYHRNNLKGEMWKWRAASRCGTCYYIKVKTLTFVLFIPYCIRNAWNMYPFEEEVVLEVIIIDSLGKMLPYYWAWMIPSDKNYLMCLTFAI